MKFTIGIHPTIFTGRGTLKDAQERFRDSIRGCFTCSSDFGNAWANGFIVSNITKVYGYKNDELTPFN